MIDMKKKWALNSRPDVPVRVLCNDNHKWKAFPVVIIDSYGNVRSYSACGTRGAGQSGVSLIPYVEKVCAYAVARQDEMLPWTVRVTRSEAESLMKGFTQNNRLTRYSVIKLEQVDETS